MIKKLGLLIHEVVLLQNLIKHLYESEINHSYITESFGLVAASSLALLNLFVTSAMQQSQILVH